MAAPVASVLLAGLSGEDGISLLPWSLEAASELQLLQGEQNAEDWVSRINASLGASKTRLEGLCLLSTMVRQCSAETFVQHGTTWIRMLTQVLQAYDTPLALQMTCHVLGSVVTQAAQFPAVAREVAGSHVPALVQALLGAQGQQWLPSAMEALQACMKSFPGPCGPFKGKMEALVCSLMDTSQPTLAQLVQQTCPLLAGCGGGGAGGARYGHTWAHLVEQVLGSLHLVLGQVYLGLGTGLQTYSAPQESLHLKTLPGSDPAKTFVLSTRFSNLCGCLRQMLGQEFPSVVQVPVPDILAFLCRALGVNGKMLFGKTSTEHVLLMAALPRMHCSVLSVLEALIISCRSELVPHASIITQLLVQTLAWTTADVGVPGRQRPYSTLRSTAYAVLTVYLSVCGAASGADSHADVILRHVLHDARPQADTTKLTAGTPGSQGTSRRQKKKPRGADMSDSWLSGQRKVDPMANSDVCSKALTALRTMLEVAGRVVKPDIHKETQEFVVPLLLRLQPTQADPPIPYSCPSCRKGLYQLLLAAVLVLHPRWPPSTQCAVRIFSLGQQDCNLQVSSFCRHALLTCMSVIHPRAPTLQSPVRIPDTPTTSKPSANQQPPSFQLLRPSATETSDSIGGNLFAASSFKSTSQSDELMKDSISQSEELLKDKSSQSESIASKDQLQESSDVPESFSKLRREEGPSVSQSDASSEGQSSSGDSVEACEGDDRDGQTDGATDVMMEVGEDVGRMEEAETGVEPGAESGEAAAGQSSDAVTMVTADDAVSMVTTDPTGLKRKHDSDGEEDSKEAEFQTMLASFVPDSTPDD